MSYTQTTIMSYDFPDMLRPLNEHTTHERQSSVIFFSRKLSCYLFAFSRLYRVIYNSLGYNIVITLFPTESILKLYAIAAVGSEIGIAIHLYWNTNVKLA